MGWARFDDRRVDHPKLLAAGLEARGLDEAAICWIAGHETDGFIPATAVEGICVMHGSKRWASIAQRLVDARRWIETDDHGTRGFYVHDYLKYNPSKEHRDEVREKKKDSGRLGGLAKAKRTASKTLGPLVNTVPTPVPSPLLKRGRGLKEPRVEPEVPVDPDAASKMRAALAEAKARFEK